MDVRTALSQIAEIHGHLARTETFRGYRSFPMGLTAATAMGAGAFQPLFVPEHTPAEFIHFWATVAGICATVVAADLAWFDGRSSSSQRRATERVVGQFLPCLAAGVMITLVLAWQAQALIPWLPGIWAVLFSMGVFASRPYLPHGIGWCGLYYLVAGGLLLLLAPSGTSLAPWGMAATFGAGQSLIALVLYWNLERKEQNGLQRL